MNKFCCLLPPQLQSKQGAKTFEGHSNLAGAQDALFSKREDLGIREAREKKNWRANLDCVFFVCARSQV